MLTLVSGGSASGKSEFAESLVVSSPCTQRFYLATMIAFDEECRRRIARHRRMRAEKNFETIEIPTGLETIVFPQEDGTDSLQNRCALLECMSNLVANEFFSDKLQSSAVCERKETVVRQVMRGVERLTKSCGEVIIVTNELFSDGIDYDEGTREYLSALGKINQEIAARADRVIEVVAGIPVVWKGAQES